MNSSSVHAENSTIELALGILEKRMKKTGASITNMQDVIDFLKLTLGSLEHEVFYLLYLNTMGQLIAHEQISRGSIKHCSIYPREIVKGALNHNASAMIIAHNHPSGEKKPSVADMQVTKRLKETLELIDCTLQDHVIVAGMSVYSMQTEGDI